MQAQGVETDIGSYYITTKEYIRTLINAESVHALIIEGETGLGKSYITLETLAECGLKPSDFVLLNTHVTPLSLFQFLYENRDKVIVFDDIDLFQNSISRGILLSALWSPTNQRVVNYLSTTDRLTVPPQFQFVGKIIVLTNRLPQELDAVKSRCFHLRLAFSFEAKIKMLCEICRLNGIPDAIPNLVKEHATPAHALNFRLPFKLWEIYRQNQNNGWEKLALLQMEISEERAILVELLQSGKTVQQQTREWTSRTGLSRATYFRYKREMESQSLTLPNVSG